MSRIDTTVCEHESEIFEKMNFASEPSSLELGTKVQERARANRTSKAAVREGVRARFCCEAVLKSYPAGTRQGGKEAFYCCYSVGY